MKLCGHGTLATAHVIFEALDLQAETIVFSSLSGDLSVKRRGARLELDFPLQLTGPSISKDLAQKALGEEIKITEVIQAYDDVIIALEYEQDVQRIAPDMGVIRKIDGLSVIVTAQSSKYDFISRVFAPRDGIDEDPVTGSAHCKLANYWAKRLNKTQFYAFQASQRSGELFLTVVGDRVKIAGTAITVAEGRLL